MLSTMKLSATNGVFLEDKLLYGFRVGALLYRVNTRLDIAFAMNKLCQYL